MLNAIRAKHRSAILVVALTILAPSHWARSADAAEPPAAADRSEAAQVEDLVGRAKLSLDEAEAAKSKEKKVAAYQAARDTARQALAIDDNDADAHFVVFAAEGRLELLSGAVPNPMKLYKAQDRLDHVLELDPSHPDGLAAKGGLYRQLPWALGGNLDKAETFLKRAIEQNPEAIGARLELAATYLDKGEPEKCGPLIDEAVAIAEKQGKIYRVEEAEKLRAQVGSE